MQRDIVFILKDINWQIYESVRLTQKFMPGTIHIVGSDPKIPDVIHHPFLDPNTVNVEANMIRKILFASALNLSQPFIVMNDDIFLTAPYEPFLGYKGDLYQEFQDCLYTRRCINTAKHLHNLRLPTYNYECHRPMPIYSMTYQIAYSQVPWEKEDDGILCFSVYGNLVNRGILTTGAKSDFFSKKLPLPVFSTPDEVSQEVRDYILSL